MIYNKVSSQKYVSIFKKKFENFLNKAPILASLVLTPGSVQVVHENTKKKYVFPWDYTKDVKQFIFEIKKSLVVHYPRIVKVTEENVELSSDEKADLIAKGEYTVENVPNYKKVTKRVIYRIDKVIVPQDIFIIVDEETGKTYRYKMNRPCVYYLRDYRSGKFKSLEEASDAFFKSTQFLNEIIPKGDSNQVAG